MAEGIDINENVVQPSDIEIEEPFVDSLPAAKRSRKVRVSTWLGGGVAIFEFGLSPGP